jgi:hypothetical protein
VCGGVVVAFHMATTTGDVYHQLTALHQDPENGRRWVFRCSCGLEKSIDFDKLAMEAGKLAEESEGVDAGGLQFVGMFGDTSVEAK